MRAIALVIAVSLLGIAAAPVADAIPVCVTHPCGPDPVGTAMTTVEKVHHHAEATMCWVAGQAGLQCQ